MLGLYFVYIIIILTIIVMNYICVGLAYSNDSIDTKLKFWTILIPGVGYLYFIYWSIKEFGTVAYKDIKEFLTEEYKKIITNKQNANERRGI